MSAQDSLALGIDHDPLDQRKISVRNLVSLVLLSGDLGGPGGFTSPSRAREGTLGHQKVQQSRPAPYEAEVPVSLTIEQDGLSLTIDGRVDGVLRKKGSLLIEEIKTRFGPPSTEAHPHHWAQAKIYAWLLLRDTKLESADVQITYLDLDSNDLTLFRETFSSESLEHFFDYLVSRYLEWMKRDRAWRHTRDASIRTTDFPFSEYRRGQRELAVTAYRAIARGKHVFIEAPTGIGKTISTIFPAIKAIAERKTDKLFYLTAKTVGRTVAEKAFADLKHNGLRFRSITLQARDKTCFKEQDPEARSCNQHACPHAIGYYDRIDDAVIDALDTYDSFTPENVGLIAHKHHVCPFELSLDISLWCDAIICDYNYVFDPASSLKRYFSGDETNHTFLIDEAHNLAERARDMFSASLNQQAIESLIPPLMQKLRDVGQHLQTLNKHFSLLATQSKQRGDHTLEKLPESLTSTLRRFTKAAETWLMRNQSASYRDDLIDFYFDALTFLRTSEAIDERYAILVETVREDLRLRLFCVDPSADILTSLEKGRCALFFSATLTPMDYFKETLGRDQHAAELKLSSPFPQEHLRLEVHTYIATTYRQRTASVEPIVDILKKTMGETDGNHLFYFSSHAYMNEVFTAFSDRCPDANTIIQSHEMKEADRKAFLERFQAGGDLVGFAVLGGIFGEGIDLVGNRLTSAVIVGVGLPGVCLDRELIRKLYADRSATRNLGFEYAYTYPGMNRVLQAAGRVIRTETDTGSVVLIDARFQEPRYQALFPSWWQPRWIHKAEES